MPKPSVRGFKATDIDLSIQALNEAPEALDSTIRDLFVHALFARVAYEDNTTEEFATTYDRSSDTIELDIPQNKLDLLCRIAIGPRMQLYMEWLVSRVRNLRKDLVHFTIGSDGGVTTGTKGIGLQFGFDGEIERVDVFADASGSLSLDLWKTSLDLYPPVAGDSIVGTSQPTLSSEQSSSLTDLAGWTTSFSQGDILYFNVDTASGIDLVTVALHVIRNSA